MSDAFSQTQETAIPENPFETLVGEGKRYKTQDELAKAAYEKDRFIEQLKSENKEAADKIAEDQKQLLKLQTVEEIYKSLKTGNTPPVEPKTTQTNEGTPPAISEVDIEKLLEDKLKNFENQKSAQQNLNDVNQVLGQKFGNNASEVVKQRAGELGMSLDELRSMASSKPKAFLSLVGATEVKTQSGQPFSTPTSTVNQSNTNPNKRNSAYYEKLKNDNPSLYFSNTTRAQKLKDALALGDDFYN